MDPCYPPGSQIPACLGYQGSQLPIPQIFSERIATNICSNGSLANGNMDQNLRSGGLNLTHTHPSCQGSQLSFKYYSVPLHTLPGIKQEVRALRGPSNMEVSRPFFFILVPLYVPQTPVHVEMNQPLFINLGALGLGVQIIFGDHMFRNWGE